MVWISLEFFGSPESIHVRALVKGKKIHFGLPMPWIFLSSAPCITVSSVIRKIPSRCILERIAIFPSLSLHFSLSKEGTLGWSLEPLRGI